MPITITFPTNGKWEFTAKITNLTNNYTFKGLTFKKIVQITFEGLSLQREGPQKTGAYIAKMWYQTINELLFLILTFYSM
jgi:hypothetical protein